MAFDWIDGSADRAERRVPFRSCVSTARAMFLLVASFGTCLFLLAPIRATAQNPSLTPSSNPSPNQESLGEPADSSSINDLCRELAELKAESERRIAELERKLAALSGSSESTESPEADVVEAEVAPLEAPAVAPSAPPSSNYFNPAISLIGNYLAVGGRNRVEGLPNSDLRESELGLQAIVDPYAKADVFLSFGEEGVEVEEGYVTFTALPANLLLEVGRKRARFGKVNTLHLHSLPWADQPLPIANLLGSDEGWIGTGVSLSRLIPLGDTFSEATVELFRGDSPGLFAGERRQDLAYNGHYRLFRDLSEASNLDVGLSYATGPNGLDVEHPSASTRLAGLDFTYRWKPLQTALYRATTVRGEVIRSRRAQPGGPQTALGWFLSGEMQLAKRWSVGARIEASEHAEDPSLEDRGGALLLTFWPSEFLGLRSELRRRKFELLQGSETANELLLQLQFAIGAHGAHPF